MAALEIYLKEKYGLRNCFSKEGLWWEYPMLRWQKAVFNL